MSISALKEIGKDALWYIPAKVIPVLAGLTGIVIYTRLLNPTEYGTYILVMTTVAMCHTFGFTWTGYVLWRYFENYKKDNNLSSFFSTIFTIICGIFFVVALLWYSATIFLSVYMSRGDSYLFRIGVAVLGSQILFSFILEVLRVTKQSKKYSIYSTSTALGVLLLVLCLCYKHICSAENILISNAIVYGVASILAMKQFSAYYGIKIPYISKIVRNKIFTFGMPQIGIATGAVVLSIADRYIIRVFMGSEAVGIYAVGYSIADLSIQLPLSALTLAAVPTIVSTFENKAEEEVSKLFNKVISMYFVFLLPVVFGIIALSRDITNIISGKAFQQAHIILPYVVVGVFFFGLTQLINLPFQLKEKPKVLMYVLYLSAFLNIAMNLFMVPQFGLIGAAYSTLIAYCIYYFISYKIVVKIFTLAFPWQIFVKALFASIIMYFAMMLFANISLPDIIFVICKVLLGIISYFSALFVFREQLIWSCLRFLINKYK